MKKLLLILVSFCFAFTAFSVDTKLIDTDTLSIFGSHDDGMVVKATATGTESSMKVVAYSYITQEPTIKNLRSRQNHLIVISRECTNCHEITEPLGGDSTFYIRS